MTDWVPAVLAQTLRQFTESREQFARAAVQQGVGIVQITVGPFQWAFLLDENVPPMHLFEFPSMEAHQKWIDRGCPIE